jgi:hypothetical protein
MNIDCTLNSLKLPGLADLNSPFGFKLENRTPIFAYDNAINSILPFKVMRPFPVHETSATTQIQTNMAFEFTTGGITLTLGNAAYSGCCVSVINSAATDAVVAFGQAAITARAKDILRLEYRGGTWIVTGDFSYALGFIALAHDYAGLANREIEKTLKQRIQQGVALIKNRGVISGCVVTKSAEAIRNVNLATGAVFMNGIEMPCAAQTNAALIPSNNSDVAATFYAYLRLDTSGKLRFACTAPDGEVPDDGLVLCRITVPAANTETNAPNLENVTLTDMRRVEAGYPAQLNSIAYASVALPFTMLDSEYEVTTELLSLKGGSAQRDLVFPGDKAANGFKLYAEGSLDMISVRWTAVKTSL